MGKAGDIVILIYLGNIKIEFDLLVFMDFLLQKKESVDIVCCNSNLPKRETSEMLTISFSIKRDLVKILTNPSIIDNPLPKGYEFEKLLSNLPSVFKDHALISINLTNKA